MQSGLLVLCPLHGSQKQRALHKGNPQNLCLCSCYTVFSYFSYVSKVILGAAGQCTNFSRWWFSLLLPLAVAYLLLLQQQTSNFLSHYWGFQIVLKPCSLCIISSADSFFLLFPFSLHSCKALAVWVWFSSQWQMFNNLLLWPLEIVVVLNKFFLYAFISICDTSEIRYWRFMQSIKHWLKTCRGYKGGICWNI